jgi:hypothetical protein
MRGPAICHLKPVDDGTEVLVDAKMGLIAAQGVPPPFGGCLAALVGARRLLFHPHRIGGGTATIISTSLSTVVVFHLGFGSV